MVFWVRILPTFLLLWVMMAVLSFGNPVTSTTDFSKWVFTQTDYLIQVSNEDAVVEITSNGDYFYIAGYSLKNMMISKIHKDGTSQWIKSFASSSQETANGIAVDSAGQSVVAAGTSDISGFEDGLVVNLSALDGSLQWYKLFGDSGTTAFNSVDVLNSEIFLVGYIVER